MNYIYGLFLNGRLIDETSVEPDDKSHAEYLFFEEYGYVRDKHEVKFLRAEEDE